MKIKYLGGSWVDDKELNPHNGYKITPGNYYELEHDLSHYDDKDSYWLKGDCGRWINVPKEFFKSPAHSTYYVIKHNDVLDTDLVLYKTDLLTLAKNYQSKNGGIITQVIS
jgi:hypothetical protein